MDLPSLRLTGQADVSVRPATPDDAASIARVQLVTWRTAFGDLLPADVLDAWDDAATTETWRRAITAPPSPDHAVLVAVDAGAVVGFAATAPDGQAREVTVLLVEPRWGRRGHGSRLLAAVADLAQAAGVPTLTSWLAEQDAVTSRFLETAGWAPEGGVRLLESGDDVVRQLCWHTRLDGDDPAADGEGTP
ncbi:GNAT family N-acetyltransferase [Modestobacter sp. VKM Ac-2986]|uniref:GNAT family N-acetyltransferase n=1 Tax=Modestobacter sp. VKM Ac-2986 TaxID=3004140 RepID=UPI0022AB54A8|nr:GNAT family N-acetyltransferase [Modestobacter sp. VKM Ac-2986]MCZ2831051.1 GNAT family N-acetyltransferase [Modestobacter sp. VKM Ac-2986]